MCWPLYSEFLFRWSTFSTHSWPVSQAIVKGTNVITPTDAYYTRFSNWRIVATPVCPKAADQEAYSPNGRIVSSGRIDLFRSNLPERSCNWCQGQAQEPESPSSKVFSMRNVILHPSIACSSINNFCWKITKWCRLENKFDKVPFLKIVTCHIGDIKNHLKQVKKLFLYNIRVA